jgi:diacylglycerol kinase (ATP)
MKAVTKNKYALLLNPSSGKQRSLANRALLEERLKYHGVAYDLYVSQSVADLRALSVQHAKNYRAIVGVGGDSTITIIANELMQKKIYVPLGMVGLGSSGDLMKELGIDSIEKACLALKAGGIRKMDLGLIKENNKIVFYFLGQANIGLGVAVNRYVKNFGARFPFLKKFQLFPGILGIIQAFRKRAVPLNISLEWNGSAIQDQFSLVLFTNIKYWATGKKFAPSAQNNDGLLNCVLVGKSGLGRFLQIAQLSTNGKHIGLTEVTQLEQESFRLRAEEYFQIQVDGDILEANGKERQFHNIEISLIKNAIKIIG